MYLPCIDQSNGGFQTKPVGQINDLAACQPTPGSEWILGKILGYDTATGLYTISDEDTESNKGIYATMKEYSLICCPVHVSLTRHGFYCTVFQLPEEQVILTGQVENLKKGDAIYGVYPETTSFYQATVVQAPRKSTSTNSNAFVMVNFHDDADEFGVTHEKPVLLKNVIYPP